MTASCEHTCKRLDDHEKVSLQNLRLEGRHGLYISYAHVHHSFMVMNIHGLTAKRSGGNSTRKVYFFLGCFFTSSIARPFVKLALDKGW